MSAKSFADKLVRDQNETDLEDRVTHLLSEWLNDNAPLGEERYRLPAKAVIEEVLKSVSARKARK